MRTDRRRVFAVLERADTRPGCRFSQISNWKCKNPAKYQSNWKYKIQPKYQNMTVFCWFSENFRNLVRRIFAFFDILTHFLQYIRVDREKCRKMAKSAQKSASIQPIFWYFELKNGFWYFGDILILWPSAKSKWKYTYFFLNICSQRADGVRGDNIIGLCDGAASTTSERKASPSRWDGWTSSWWRAQSLTK